MEIKKSYKVDLDRHWLKRFLIGLAIALSLFVAVLEFPVRYGGTDTEDDSMDDVLQEMAMRKKQERQDMIAVVEPSRPRKKQQQKIKVVDKTLADLGCADKPSMIIFNKIDAYTWVEKEADDLTPATKENMTLDDLKKTWMAKMGDDCLFISAREKINIQEMRDVIYKRVKQLHVQKYPYNDFLYQDYSEEEQQ